MVGDYSTAAGLLLASTPERSARYYRDALAALALATAVATLDSVRFRESGGGGGFVEEE